MKLLTWALLLVLCFRGEPSAPIELVAHRGASHDAPENTLAAFKLGWEQHADANELDIHLTKDGRIAVLHDPDTRRTAGLDRPVAQQTLQELRSLDAGIWKEARWRGEKIPTLDEALTTLPEGRRMFIEIKCGAEVLPELERVLEASGKGPSQLVLIGFDYETMNEAKSRFPRLAVYWLVSPTKDSDGLDPPVTELIQKAKAAHFDGLNLSSKFAWDASFVAPIKQAGLKLYVWTVDDLPSARKLVKLEVDGITTNRPGWMRSELGLPVPEVTARSPGER